MCVAGFISIDCGLSGNTGYVSETTRLSYVTDAGFIDAGTNHDISDEFMTHYVDKLSITPQQTLPHTRDERTAVRATGRAFLAFLVVDGQLRRGGS
jgi:hypothetical protein